jgi:hypothetical protein
MHSMPTRLATVLVASGAAANASGPCLRSREARIAYKACEQGQPPCWSRWAQQSEQYAQSGNPLLWLREAACLCLKNHTFYAIVSSQLLT